MYTDSELNCSDLSAQVRLGAQELVKEMERFEKTRTQMNTDKVKAVLQELSGVSNSLKLFNEHNNLNAKLSVAVGKGESSGAEGRSIMKIPYKNKFGKSNNHKQTKNYYSKFDDVE